MTASGFVEFDRKKNMSDMGAAMPGWWAVARKIYRVLRDRYVKREIVLGSGPLFEKSQAAGIGYHKFTPGSYSKKSHQATLIEWPWILDEEKNVTGSGQNQLAGARAVWTGGMLRSAFCSH